MTPRTTLHLYFFSPSLFIVKMWSRCKCHDDIGDCFTRNSFWMNFAVVTKIERADLFSPLFLESKDSYAGSCCNYGRIKFRVRAFIPRGSLLVKIFDSHDWKPAFFLPSEYILGVRLIRTCHHLRPWVSNPIHQDRAGFSKKLTNQRRYSTRTERLRNNN